MGGNQPASHCDQYPDTGKIVVILRTNAIEALDKLPTQLITSALCVTEPLLFSDLQQSLGPHTIYDVLAFVSPEAMDRNEDFDIYRKQHELAASGRETEIHSLGSLSNDDDDLPASGKLAARLDKYKTLHSIELAWQLRPDVDWYVFLEADTYLSWPNLVHYLAVHDPKEHWYFGGMLDEYEHLAPFSSAHGGAGYILSGPVVREWNASPGRANDWDERVRDMPDGDYVLSMALIDTHITDATPMIGTEKPAMVAFGPENWCLPVVTLRNLDPRQLDKVYKAEIALPGSRMLFRDLHSAVDGNGYPFKHDDWANGADDARYAIGIVPNDMEKTKGQWEPKDLVDPNQNALSCEFACIQNEACFMYMFTITTDTTNLETTTACHLSSVFRRGEERKPGNSQDGKVHSTTWTSGWRSDRIARWIEEHQQCPMES